MGELPWLPEFSSRKARRR